MKALDSDLKRFLARGFAWVLILLLMLNPLNNRFLAGAGNQDFFLYHLRDVVTFLDKGEEGAFPLLQPDSEEWKEHPYFGMAQGKNLIMIQLESMQNLVIDMEYEGKPVTPFLNELIQEEGTFYFDNMYHQLGSGNTSDAEFAANNSLLGTVESYTYQLFQDNYFKGLPHILKEKGYSTAVFHGYKKEFWNRENVYPTLGFDAFYGDSEFISDDIQGLGSQRITGVSDKEFFRQSAEIMKGLPKPFYSFFITLSSHYPFLNPENFNFLQVPEKEKTICTDYLNLIHYTDSALEVFFRELKDQGLYEDSMIVLYGDHFGMPKSDPDIAEKMGELLGREYGYKELMNIPLIIHIPGSEATETLSIAGGQLDILPTLGFLMGMEKLDTLYLGQNLFTAKKGFVPFQVQLLKGSFANDEIIFEFSRDGIFENSRGYNISTGEEIQEVAPYREESEKAAWMVDLSRFYLEKDILRLALEQGLSQGEINHYLSGTVFLPKHPVYRYIGSSDPEGLKGVVRNLEEDEERTFLLSSDQTEVLLKDFASRYSGKSGEPVAIQLVDDDQNQRFLSYKERILPATGDMKVYSKLEYLGYTSLAFEIQTGRYSPAELNQFITLKNPQMLVVEGEGLLEYASLLQNIGKPFLVKNIHGETLKALAAMLGAYGTVIGEE